LRCSAKRDLRVDLLDEKNRPGEIVVAVIFGSV
jgi:hypothetical protein